MRKFLVVCTALLAGAGIARADFVWRFDADTNTVTGAANEDAIVWDLDTGAGTVATSTSSDDTRFNAWVSLSGSGTADDSFTMSMEAGFGFDPSNPSYDTSDYVGTALPNDEQNTFRFRFNNNESEGVGALGQGVGFSGAQSGVVDSEILHFTISGLAPGQSFVLKGFELKDAAPGRVDLFYGTGVTKYDTATAIEDVSSQNIVLGNGDQFGFGYDRDTGNRSAFKALRFDITVIPEPGTVTLFATGLLGLMALRRIRRS